MTKEITTDAELMSRLITTQPTPSECLVAAARIEQLKDSADVSAARIADLERQLAEARDRALEEAAAWLDSQALTLDEINQGYGFTKDYPLVAAKAIRNLKGTP